VQKSGGQLTEKAMEISRFTDNQKAEERKKNERGRPRTYISKRQLVEGHETISDYREKQGRVKRGTETFPLCAAENRGVRRERKDRALSSERRDVGRKRNRESRH